MDIFAAFQTNLVDTGKEFPLSDTAYITLLPVGGETAARHLENMMAPYSARLKAGNSLTKEENKALNVKFYAQYIIQGWRGLKGKDGAELPYSKDMAMQLLSDPKMVRLFNLIVQMATNDSAFEAEQAAADEGNS